MPAHSIVAASPGGRIRYGTGPDAAEALPTVIHRSTSSLAPARRRRAVDQRRRTDTHDSDRGGEFRTGRGTARRAGV
ncbi:hypothetical protein JS756_15670 [Streptomyces actuosus]|uniref:Uncharacterized protein n=1 Tax=Streptomyces actuosus TaxID=1885 RepID=A0ABS2VQX7_STRAS|nr:hypothetical protein [Streptomyces actuosus]MBN0045519.1 hypothetical protein [Streptomyces actuosus]